MTNNDQAALTELQAIAGEAFAVLNTGDQISPFSARFSGFNLEAAYRVTAAIRQMREAHGEVPMGRKIGFTNRTLWTEYGVGKPIWDMSTTRRFITSPISATPFRSRVSLSQG